MEYINGEFIMTGCGPDDPGRIKTAKECASFIQDVGFLPLFSNAIPGFSVEEHTTASQWWTEDPETDPWAWRQILSSDPDIAYGKFFGRNAGFVSKECFPVFANYRRNGYDFDALFEDELAGYRAKKIMDVIEMDEESKGRQILSSELKQAAGFTKEGGEKNFEGVIVSDHGGFPEKKKKKRAGLRLAHRCYGNAGNKVGTVFCHKRVFGGSRSVMGQDQRPGEAGFP